MRYAAIPVFTMIWTVVSGPAWAQTVRVSVIDDETQLSAPSAGASADATGRLVVFTTEGAEADFYIRDVEAGTTTPVLLGPAGTRANQSVVPILSGDGQHVIFVSRANNIVAGVPSFCGTTETPPPCSNVYALNRATGVVTLVSHDAGNGGGNRHSHSAAVSHDGRFVVFESDASNLVAGDTNAGPDIFVFDRETSSLRRVSVTSAGAQASFGPGWWDFYPGPPSISANGRFVTFGSGANNLAPGDTARDCILAYVGPVDCPNVFVHDLHAGTTDLVSLNSAGQPADLGARYGVTSDDGRYVAFVSNAGNLGAGPSLPRDSNSGLGGVFIRDRVLGTTVPVWKTAVDLTFLSTAHLSISTDGRVVGFSSGTPLVPGIRSAGTYIWERGQGLRALAGPDGAQLAAKTGALTPDGRWFVLTSASDAIVPGDTNGVDDVFRVSLTDWDGDTLPDVWETAFALDPGGASGDDGAQGDPDKDGRTNAQEFASQTHPRGAPAATRYFAEGATSSFFETRLAIANPGTQPAHVLLRFDRTDGTGGARSTTMLVPAGQSRKIAVSTIDGMSEAEFATVLESDQPVVAERQMWWSALEGYGTHSERALTAPASTWYFAEGATTGNFNLFYLLQNPGDVAAEVRVRYLRAQGAPIEKTYTLPARSRTNIWANVEDVNGQRPLASAEFSAEVTVLSGPPIIAERAMYLNAGASTRLFEAGHEAAGVTAASTEWFFAEGATGTYFDTFILLANPASVEATVEGQYLLQDGSVITKSYVVPAASRYTIWIDQEDARLANVAVSVRLRSLNATPIVAERAMWWPGPTSATWQEAHASAGSTVSATRWAIADGVVEGAPGFTETYVLMANLAAQPARVRVTLLYDDGLPAEAKEFNVAPESRYNVDVRAEFPRASGRGFGALIESLDGQTLVVERSLYNDAHGVRWAAGANALATPLP